VKDKICPDVEIFSFERLESDIESDIFRRRGILPEEKEEGISHSNQLFFMNTTNTCLCNSTIIIYKDKTVQTD